MQKYSRAALERMAQAGDYEGIMHAVYTMPRLIPDEYTDFLLHLFEKLGPEFYRKLPVAANIYSRVLFSQGKVREAEETLQRILRRFLRKPQSPLRDRLICDTYNNIGMNRIIAALGDDAYDFNEYFEKACFYFETSDHHIESGPVANLALGPYALRVGPSGDFQAYMEATDASIPFAMHSLNGCMAGLQHLVRAELAYFQYELKTCLHEAFLAAQLANTYRQYEVKSMAMFYMLRAYVGQGDADQVKQVFKDLGGMLREEDYWNRMIHYDLIKGWFMSVIGRIDLIPAWILSDFDSPRLNHLSAGAEDTVKSRYFIDNRDDEKHLTFLQSLHGDFGVSAFTFGQIGIKLNYAIIYYRSGELERSLDYFEKAYQQALPQQLFGLFYEYGNNLRGVCANAMRNSKIIPVDWLQQAITKGTTAAKRIRHLRTKYDEFVGHNQEMLLSPRETSILFNLVQGLTRKEVAAELGISLNTVKSMLSNIFNKLGTSNILDTVRVATKAGILD
jgi:LuxR family maltose regulon positive regulatory protein